MTGEVSEQLKNEAEVYRLACLYARGADRRDAAIWNAILTDDIVLVTPAITLTGRDKVVASLDMLGRMFVATQHRIHNQLYSFEGDRATGETYSTADHVIEGEEGSRKLLSWALRYEDELRHDGSSWRFSRRTLHLDWSEERPLPPAS